MKYKHGEIYLDKDINVKKIEERLRVYISTNTKKTAYEELLIEKLELLIKKVQDILEMYPLDMTLNINVYKTQEQLDEVYFQITGKHKKNCERAFYVFKNKTVYITEKKFTVEILAHEIAHSVTNHYFKKLIPIKIKELMSQYVERNL